MTTEDMCKYHEKRQPWQIRRETIQLLGESPLRFIAHVISSGPDGEVDLIVLISYSTFIDLSSSELDIIKQYN